MKKIAIFLVVLLALAGAVWFTLTSVIIDSDDMAEQLRSSLQSATGRDVQIGTDAKVSLFPPQVTFNGLQVSNIEGASTAEMLRAPQFTLTLDMGKLLSGDAAPSSLVLKEAELNFEVLPGNRKNWDFRGQNRQSDNFRTYFLNTPVTLENATLRYTNAATGSFSEVAEIKGDLAYKEDGSVMEFNGAMSMHGQDTQVMLRTRSVDMTAGGAADAPFQLALKQGETAFKLQGTLSSATTEPEFIGQVEVDAADIWSAMRLFTGHRKGVDYNGQSSFPVNAKGEVTLSMQRMVLKDMKLLAAGDTPIPGLKGTVDMEYRFGKNPVYSLKPAFETVDMDYLMTSYDGAFSAAAEPVEQAESDDFSTQEQGRSQSAFENFLRKATGNVLLTVDNLIYQGRSINKITISATAKPRLLTIREGRASLPGETRFAFNGRLYAEEKGVGYNGRMLMQGKEMEQFLSLFTPKDVEVPALELGAFALQTNVLVDGEQIRLSELRSRVSDTGIGGAVIVKFGDRPVIESFMKLSNINLDTMRKTAEFLLPKTEGVKAVDDGTPGGAIINTQYINTQYDWLAGIGLDVDANFLLEDFVLFDREGQRAEFHLTLSPNTAMIDNVKAYYNGAAISGTYALQTQQGANPIVTIDTDISELNLVDIFPEIARSRNDEEWQAYLNEQLRLMLLQTYRANIKARIGALQFREYVFDKVTTEIQLAENRLQVEKFTGFLWDGGLNARALVQAGTIPSYSLSFALNNSSLIKMSQASRLLQHAAGRVSVGGRVAGSGATLRSWLSNAKGEMEITGTDISIQGFGIADLSRAVPTARTVNDIERAGKKALNSGNTRMSSLEGIINISEGKASTPRMNYKARESEGSVSGTVDVVEEELDLMMTFYLLNTVNEGETPPQLTLRLEGEIDNIEKTLNTRELENYVSQTAMQRALSR